MLLRVGSGPHITRASLCVWWPRIRGKFDMNQSAKASPTMHCFNGVSTSRSPVDWPATRVFGTVPQIKVRRRRRWRTNRLEELQRRQREIKKRLIRNVSSGCKVQVTDSKTLWPEPLNPKKRLRLGGRRGARTSRAAMTPERSGGPDLRRASRRKLGEKCTRRRKRMEDTLALLPFFTSLN